MRFSQLQRNEETKDVELRFGDDVLHITVYPHRRSIGWQRKIKKAIDDNDVGAIADLFFTTLQSWDLTDDDGNVLPFTEEVIDGFGLETFGEVNTKLNEVLNPNPEDLDLVAGWFSDPDYYEVEAKAGRKPPLPDYVDDWLIAKWMGVTVGDLEYMPHWEVDQARIVRHAEFKAQEAAQKKQAKKSGKR